MGAERAVMMFEIVCPDGVVRHLPYHQRSDAVFDARVCTTRSNHDANGCNLYPQDPPQDPPCPGGTHTVRVATS
jgi:hypothetical protein